MNSIDIDVGGTFTDLVLNFDGKALIKKVPTTPYDLSVCFSRVIEEGAAALGLKMDELLPAIDMIRYSTTIAMNRLIEKKGPRLGLDHDGRPRRRGADRPRRAVDRRHARAGTPQSRDPEKARAADSSRHDRGREGARGFARQRSSGRSMKMMCAKKSATW